MLIKFKKKIKRIYYILFIPKYKFIIKNKYASKKYNILDIGCGGNSPSQTKLIFPNSRYVGVDRDFNYHNDKNSINLIDKKIELDLNKNINILSENIADENFDIIIINHAIEHTTKGLEILNMVLKKLKKNGSIYIEFPSIRSLNLPSMRGTLNFCDDKTHLRLYSVHEISNIILSNNCKIIKAGRRLNLVSILIIPLRILNCIFFNKSPAGVFWDLLGFADFVYASKY